MLEQFRMQAIVVEHKYQRSLLPGLVIRNGYERIWVSPLYWLDFGQIQKAYEIKFSGNHDQQMETEDDFQDWLAGVGEDAFILEEDKYGILHYTNETIQFHCWCATFHQFLEESGYQLINGTDKVHIYEYGIHR